MTTTEGGLCATKQENIPLQVSKIGDLVRLLIEAGCKPERLHRRLYVVLHQHGTNG
jgi:hypothetical protein